MVVEREDVGLLVGRCNRMMYAFPMVYDWSMLEYIGGTTTDAATQHPPHYPHCRWRHVCYSKMHVSTFDRDERMVWLVRTGAGKVPYCVAWILVKFLVFPYTWRPYWYNLILWIWMRNQQQQQQQRHQNQLLLIPVPCNISSIDIIPIVPITFRLSIILIYSI